MKKIVLAGAVVVFLLSCNSNPSATGDSKIMEQEKKENALEWQKTPPDTILQNAAGPMDTATVKGPLPK